MRKGKLLANSSYSFSTHSLKSTPASQTSHRDNREHTRREGIHLLINLTWKRTSSIYTPSQDESHIKSHLEMERKDWGKEGKGDSIQTHGIKKGNTTSK